MENQINEDMLQPIDVIQPQVEIPKKKLKKDTYKTKQCKVIVVTDKIVGLSFDGYGISVPRESYAAAKIGDVISIEYRGEIGTTNFKIKK